MSTATIILFPDKRTPLIHVLQKWWAHGYKVSNNKHNRLVLVRDDRSTPLWIK